MTSRTSNEGVHNFIDYYALDKRHIPQNETDKIYQTLANIMVMLKMGATAYIISMSQNKTFIYYEL